MRDLSPRFAITGLLISAFACSTASANPVTPGAGALVTSLLLPIFAEIVVTMLVLGVPRPKWAFAFCGIAVLQIPTLLLLFSGIGVLEAWIGWVSAIVVAEVGVTLIEAAFYTSQARRNGFAWTFGRCLAASVAGNLTSFTLGYLLPLTYSAVRM